MITHIFDNGWGPQWPLKKLEQQILDQYLRPLAQSLKSVAVINSTWYDNNYHTTVLTKLQHHPVDVIVLVSMLDCAIPKRDMYTSLNTPVLEVGNYRSEHAVDYWSIVTSQHMDVSDYGNLLDASRLDVPYMCLNRKPHWHRVQLYQALNHANLVDRGFVSLGGNNGQAPQQLLKEDAGISNLAPNPGKEQNGINNDIMSLGHPDNWHRHFLNIVTETVFDLDSNHFVTEKIFKPIVGCRPFLVYDPTGAGNWLSSRGFEHYLTDFKDISDLDLSQPSNLAPFLVTLCEQPNAYLQSKLLALQSKILYNKNRFDTYVQEQLNKISQGIQCQI